MDCESKWVTQTHKGPERRMSSALDRHGWMLRPDWWTGEHSRVVIALLAFPPVPALSFLGYFFLFFSLLFLCFFLCFTTLRSDAKNTEEALLLLLNMLER